MSPCGGYEAHATVDSVLPTGGIGAISQLNVAASREEHIWAG